MEIKNRITTLSLRMNKLDKFVKNNNANLKCDLWQRYFKLINICSSEYAKLIRL